MYVYFTADYKINTINILTYGRNMNVLAELPGFVSPGWIMMIMKLMAVGSRGGGVDAFMVLCN